MIVVQDIPRLETIVFDLGGVIVDIDYTLTERAFARLSSRHFTYSRHRQPDEVTLFETGAIGSEEFRSAVAGTWGIDAEAEAIDHAWNAMILGEFAGRRNLIHDLRKRYSVVLLSNTNAIHHAFIDNRFAGLFNCFDRCYFSHRMGMRKPSPAIFEAVLADLGAKASTTLFIDDSPQHTEGARSVGIHTWDVIDPLSVEMLRGLCADSEQRTA